MSRRSILVIFFTSLFYSPIGWANPVARALPPEVGYIASMKKNRAALPSPREGDTPVAKVGIDHKQIKNNPAVKDLIDYFESQVEKFQGGAIAIIHQGLPIYTKVFGHTKADTNQPITRHTLFPLGSTSKSIVAVATALLVEKGKLKFKQRFELPYLKYPVRLEDILGHTTGYAFSGNAQIEQGLDRATLLEKLKDQNPQGQPGYYYYYSNTLFSLVEEVLQAKNIQLDDLLYTLRKSLQTKEITLIPLGKNQSIAYQHLAEKKEGKDTFETLPFPSHYATAVPAAAGVFASLTAMIHFFSTSLWL